MKDKIIKYYFLPTVISVIASFQLFGVKNNLTRWKGGGFGMYSQYHFSEYEIWINHKNNKDIESKKIKNLIWEIKKQPNDLNSINLIKALNLKNDTIVLQVWKPKFEHSRLKYRRELAYEIIYLNNKGNK